MPKGEWDEFVEGVKEGISDRGRVEPLEGPMPDGVKLTDKEILWLSNDIRLDLEEGQEYQRESLERNIIDTRRASSDAATEKAWHARDAEVAKLQQQLGTVREQMRELLKDLRVAMEQADEGYPMQAIADVGRALAKAAL